MSSSALCRTLVFYSLYVFPYIITRLYRKVCSLLFLFCFFFFFFLGCARQALLVGRRLLLLFQALEKKKKSSSDPVRPFVRVCIYKETSSSFASTMPPTRTQKNKKRFVSHRIYILRCVYLSRRSTYTRGSRVKTLCFRVCYYCVRMHLKSWIGLREMAVSNEFVLPFSGHAGCATFL